MMNGAVKAYIGLGANLGDTGECLGQALRMLDSRPGIRVTRVSSLYVTEPIDSFGPDYTNACAELETTLSARELLRELLETEAELGRVRPAGVHNAPRTIDLDLELYGGSVISEAPSLIVPHPRMHERRFVLAPLLEIAPEAVIPGKGAAKDFLQEVLGQRLDRTAEFCWKRD